MISAQRIKDVILSGIRRFEKPYKQPAENIQIVFSLNARAQVEYMTCVNQVPKNTVTINQLIGSNLYNFAVNGHIRKLLETFAEQNQCKPSEINLMAGVKAENHVYIWLRCGNKMIRQVTDDELKK